MKGASDVPRLSLDLRVRRTRLLASAARVIPQFREIAAQIVDVGRGNSHASGGENERHSLVPLRPDGLLGEPRMR